ncbi:aquaporin [Dictyobacter sp. S3.2.2.5]|uniref:Aquaporin n=1 Tax=Dictyobacter halimunensis TaxID=3026934 RepID=A0ABQ6FP01_9CHLR|nr:aquaporin [Dictyobacter sp. S3.2.2.5]
MMRQHKWWTHLHWPEYGAELLGTAFLLFFGISAGIFDFDTSFPLVHLLPNQGLRLLITGLLFAGGGALVALSPPGMLSGGHINPAVSLAFWLQGKMHHSDLAGYLLGQFLGAIIGSALVVLAWGEHAYRAGVGRTVPGAGYPLWFVFLMEVGMTFLLVFFIFLFVSHHRLMRWTPFMVWILVAVLVWLGAPVSGTSLNPARSFGPAFVSWFWQDQWLYWLAPVAGALCAVGVFRLLTANKRDVLTGKLFHMPHYRSVFKDVKAPCLPANGKLKATERYRAAR